VEQVRSFGAEVRKAIGCRLKWLAAPRLIDLEKEGYPFRSGVVDQLEQRTLKARHQFYLPDDLSDALNQLCPGRGRPRRRF
jgi:hypothetical protein